MRRPRRSTTSSRSPRRPVVASHTGVRGACDNAPQPVRRPAPGDRGDRRPRRHRVLADAPVGGEDVGLDRPLDPPRRRRWPACDQSARLRLRRRGPGAVRRRPGWSASPMRCSRPASPSAAIRAVMGGNALRLLAETLPDGRMSGASRRPTSASIAVASPRDRPCHGRSPTGVSVTRHPARRPGRRRARRRRARDDRLARRSGAASSSPRARSTAASTPSGTTGRSASS